MDPILTVVFVAAFVLLAFAAFGGLLGSGGKSAKTGDSTGMPDAGLDPLAALAPGLSTVEPVWVDQISLWQRFRPLVIATTWLGVLAVGAVGAIWAYGTIPGFSFQNDVHKTVEDGIRSSYEDTMRSIAAQKPANMPEIKGMEQTQFKMPEPPAFLRDKR